MLNSNVVSVADSCGVQLPTSFASLTMATVSRCERNQRSIQSLSAELLLQNTYIISFTDPDLAIFVAK